jgi:hypothetical protein
VEFEASLGAGEAVVLERTREEAVLIRRDMCHWAGDGLA